MKSDSELKEQLTIESKFLLYTAIIFAITGLLVILIFLLILSKQFSILSSGEIQLEETAQVGDFIGGVVGSLWSFTGILLFYLALRLQRKEFKLQRNELTLQRKELRNQVREFRISRITNVIFNQLSKIDTRINTSEFTFYYGIDFPEESKKGNSGIYELNNTLEEYYLEIIETEECNNINRPILEISSNKETIEEIFEVVINSHKVTEKLIENSSESESLDEKELRFIFKQNLSSEIRKLALHIAVIVKEYQKRQENLLNTDQIDGDDESLYKFKGIFSKSEIILNIYLK